jgi:hypothetical protein
MLERRQTGVIDEEDYMVIIRPNFVLELDE